MYDDIITKIENRPLTTTEVNFVLYIFYIPVYILFDLKWIRKNYNVDF
jgi:hypothetical protein